MPYKIESLGTFICKHGFEMRAEDKCFIFEKNMDILKIIIKIKPCEYRESHGDAECYSVTALIYNHISNQKMNFI